MALFDKNNRKGGLMDEIRCDEPSYLIWKWHPSGSQLGTNNRENAIRWGSSLRVKDGEVAVFVFHRRSLRRDDQDGKLSSAGQHCRACLRRWYTVPG